MRYTTGWVKLRRNDPPTFELLSIEAQAFYCLLTRLLDSQGNLSLPPAVGLRGLCRELRGVGAADWPRIKAYLEELCEEGSLRWDAAAGILHAPRHVEDQRAHGSDEADRKRVYRARMKNSSPGPQSVPESGRDVLGLGTQCPAEPDQPQASLQNVPKNGTSGQRSLEEDLRNHSSGGSPASVERRAAQLSQPWIDRDGEAVPMERARALLAIMHQASRDAGGTPRLLLMGKVPSQKETLDFQAALSRPNCFASESEVAEMGRLLAQGEFPNRGRGAALSAVCAYGPRGDAFAELLAKAKAPPLAAGTGSGTARAPGRVPPSASAESTPPSAAELRAYMEQHR